MPVEKSLLHAEDVAMVVLDMGILGSHSTFLNTKYSQTRNPDLHTVPQRQQAHNKDQEDHNASRLLIHVCFANGSIVRRATSYIVQHHQCKPRSRQGEMGGISLSHGPQIHPTVMLVRPFGSV